jgi:flagellar basal-body rod modification protein FlgD
LLPFNQVQNAKLLKIGVKTMSINPVNNSSYASGNYPSRNPTNALGKEDFLNLLVTQLKYQDPLNPTDNSNFAAQLAQFSALEQMSNMSAGISSMEALSMTGKYVTAIVTDSETGKTTAVEGIVDSVEMKNGEATLVVGGNKLKLEDITNVYDYDRSDIYNLSSLIGKMCKGYIYDSENLAVIGVEGSVVGVEKGTYEDYALMNGVKGELDSITSDDYKSSQNKFDYLKSHIGEEISIKVKDSTTGKVVPMTATLDAVTKEEDGSITVTMNNVRIPVDGIYSVT